MTLENNAEHAASSYLAHRHEDSTYALEPGEINGIAHDAALDHSLPDLANHLPHLEEPAPAE